MPSRHLPRPYKFLEGLNQFNSQASLEATQLASTNIYRSGRL